MKKASNFMGCAVALSLALTACTSSDHVAPIVSINQQPNASQNTYTVRRGDTLYSIAWGAGLDVDDLAAANHLSPPYALSPGQVLSLHVAPAKHAPIPAEQPTQVASASPSTLLGQTVYWSPKKHVRAPAASSSARPEKRVGVSKPVSSEKPRWFESNTNWIWPVQGRVVDGFSMASGGNRGLNIAKSLGTPIVAAASGQVVYSGSGVRGYGNMIIIQNAKHFLSAYAFNQKNLVQTGAWVRQGQTIATMGRNSAGQVMLHFEIRIYGRAVDPMRYLPRRAM